MSRKKKQKITIMHLDSIENTRLHKPKYNGWQTGHGVHGDTSYNRNKERRELRRLLDEE